MGVYLLWMQFLHHLLWLGLPIVIAQLLWLLLWRHVLGLLIIQLIGSKLVELAGVLEHGRPTILISEWVLELTT